MVDEHINSKNIDKYKSGSVITLPAEAAAISISDFKEYKDIENIYVSPDNKYFSSVDGVLFSKNKTHIIFCPSAKRKISIPAEVEKIDRSDFEHCEDLEEINVDKRNQSYVSVDGILFSKKEPHIIFCPKYRKNITLPSGTITITDDYFSALTNSYITSISIPASVQEIKGNPFSNLDNLEEINVDARNQFYSSVDGILSNHDKTSLFYCPNNKKHLAIPDNTITINDDYFSLSALESSTITSINIPASVQEIVRKAFKNLTVLEEINVDAHNQFYSSVDGILSNHDKTSFFYCPNNKKHLAIPDGTITINDDYFSALTNSYITSINIPASVQDIEGNPFKNLNVLEEINVDEQNRSYSSFNGILLNKDKTCRISFPPNESTSICTDIIIIDGILYNSKKTHLISCSNKEIIKIDSSVFVIEKNAFKKCKDIKIIEFLHKDNASLPIIEDGVGEQLFNSKDLHIKVSKTIKLKKERQWLLLEKYCTIDYVL